MEASLSLFLAIFLVDLALNLEARSASVARRVTSRRPGTAAAPPRQRSPRATPNPGIALARRGGQSTLAGAQGATIYQRFWSLLDVTNRTYSPAIQHGSLQERFPRSGHLHNKLSPETTTGPG